MALTAAIVVTVAVAVSLSRCHGRCRCHTVGAMAGRFQASREAPTWTLALCPHPKRRLRAVSVMAAVTEMAFRAATKFVKMFCQLTK